MPTTPANSEMGTSAVGQSCRINPNTNILMIITLLAYQSIVYEVWKNVNLNGSWILKSWNTLVNE